MPGIRRATPRDLEELLALWTALTEHHAAREPLFELRPEADAEIRLLLARQLRDADAATFVSASENMLVGFCTARIGAAPPIHAETARAEITDLGVREEQRRRGVGRALVDAVLAWVRERGVARVEIRVATTNEEGQAFWRSQGFGPFMDVLHRRL